MAKKVKQIVDHGFVPPKKDTQAYQYGDGNVIYEVLHEDANWEGDVPTLEIQNKYFETFHCTVFNTIKPLLSIMYKKYGNGMSKDEWFAENNKSERFSGVIGGLVPTGGSPQTVVEGIRKFGLLPQKLLDWTPDLTSFWKYSSPRPMTKALLDEAHKFLDEYNVYHDWVRAVYGNKVTRFIKGVLGMNKLGASQIEMMKDALRYSPLGVSVLAWKFRNGKAYKFAGETDNHWTMCVGYKESEYWLIYDSYTNQWVKCEWNYPFGYVKQYAVIKKNSNSPIMTTGQDLYTRLKGKFILRSRGHGELYYVAKDIEFVPVYIGNSILAKEFDAYLRAKSTFIGISESDFSLLSAYVATVGGKVGEAINIEEKLKSLI